MFKFNFQVDEENDVISSNPSFEDSTIAVPDIHSAREALEHEFPMVRMFIFM